MKYLVVWMLLCVPILFALSALSQQDVAAGIVPTTATIWSSLHVPLYGDTWKARSDGYPVWPAMYAKQTQQIQFRLVGLFNGDGTVLLSYGDEGDTVEFHFLQPTAMTVDTVVPLGGGTVPIPLNVYLSQYGPTPPSITNPNVFVGQ